MTFEAREEDEEEQPAGPFGLSLVHVHAAFFQTDRIVGGERLQSGRVSIRIRVRLTMLGQHRC